MSAQMRPFPILQPVVGMPVPTHEWKPGQTIGEFAAKLRSRGYAFVLTPDGWIVVRSH